MVVTKKPALDILSTTSPCDPTRQHTRKRSRQKTSRLKLSYHVVYTAQLRSQKLKSSPQLLPPTPYKQKYAYLNDLTSLGSASVFDETSKLPIFVCIKHENKRDSLSTIID